MPALRVFPWPTAVIHQISPFASCPTVQRRNRYCLSPYCLCFRRGFFHLSPSSVFLKVGCNWTLSFASFLQFRRTSPCYCLYCVMPVFSSYLSTLFNVDLAVSDTSARWYCVRCCGVCPTCSWQRPPLSWKTGCAKTRKSRSCQRRPAPEAVHWNQTFPWK